jgi:hypothetical protein
MLPMKISNTIFIPIAALIVTLFYACEKNITVDLPASKPEVVLEGYVEPGFAPYVYLAYSTGYFDPVDSAALAKNLIKNALVIISDGFTTDTMYELIPGYGYFYAATQMTGTIGRTYTLTVTTQKGEKLSAKTILHPPVPLDSIYYKTIENNDTLGFVWGRLTDPDTVGNYYRWLAKRITKDDTYYAPFGSAFEDKFINGTSLDFSFNRGVPPNSDSDEEDSDLYKKGDTVIVKFCAIDKTSYSFWREAETQSGNNGNPFGSVSPINSGVTGGLGIFCAYSPSYDTLICK